MKKKYIMNGNEKFAISNFFYTMPVLLENS